MYGNLLNLVPKFREEKDIDLLDFTFLNTAIDKLFEKATEN